HASNSGIFRYRAISTALRLCTSYRRKHGNARVPWAKDARNIAMPTIFGKKYAREELLRRVGHVQQIGGVQLLCSDDGPSRGVRLLEFRTGTGFSFKVCVDRGMDVGYCEYRGASLAWIPPTLLPGPWFFEQQTDFGWLRSALG